MSSTLTHEQIVSAVLEEFARLWGERLGGTAAVAPSGEAQGVGWAVSMTMSGAINGRVTVWADREAATACTRKVLSVEREPDEQEIGAFLRDLVGDASKAVSARSGFEGVFWTEPVSRVAPALRQLQVSYLAIANTASCIVGVTSEPQAPPPPAPSPTTDHRLEAVLDVELPLVVRFGRAIMPLKTLADLGPGSVVDMGRSPDEPVELLVGERVIARGEVVVVAGNYGVRITELSSRQGAGDMEARLL